MHVHDDKLCQKINVQYYVSIWGYKNTVQNPSQLCPPQPKKEWMNESIWKGEKNVVQQRISYSQLSPKKILCKKKDEKAVGICFANQRRIVNECKTIFVVLLQKAGSFFNTFVAKTEPRGPKTTTTTNKSKQTWALASSLLLQFWSKFHVFWLIFFTCPIAHVMKYHPRHEIFFGRIFARQKKNSEKADWSWSKGAYILPKKLLFLPTPGITVLRKVFIACGSNG